MGLELVSPALTWAQSFVAAERELIAAGERIDRPEGQSIEKYIVALQNFTEGSSPEDAVPSTILWLVNGGEYIGRVSLRPSLNEWLSKFGGHIGFIIRPSKRSLGFGTAALRLVLPVAAAHGLEAVLVTCEADNVASQRIIERNGGVFEGEVPEPSTGVTMRRYWVSTGR